MTTQSDGGSPRRVLVIDDDAAIVQMLTDYFQTDHAEEAYVVESAPNGPEGITAIVRARPDLVILDIKMPGMDGVEVLKHIRRLDPTLPVIMLTANVDITVAEATMKHGAVCYVPKPVNFQYLDHLVALFMTRPGRAASS